MKITIRQIFSPILTLFVLFSSCSSENSKRADLIAKVGEKKIDWTILNRSFYLEPKWGKGLTNKQAYSNQLNFLIDQKLFAQAAISNGLDKETANKNYLSFIKEKEMIKELYRQEVESQIEITEEEYISAYKKLKSHIKVAFITTPHEESAKRYLNLYKRAPLKILFYLIRKMKKRERHPFLRSEKWLKR